MTTTVNRMTNFKRMAERLARGQKLLTSVEKSILMALPLPSEESRPLEALNKLCKRVRLVMHAAKKHVPH